MKNKLHRWLLILCCVPLLSAAKLADVQIQGIHGDVLLNVQHRLAELYPGKSITTEQPDVIRTQIEKAMYPYGLFRPQIVITPATKGASVQVHIIPGPQMRVTTLTVNVIGEGKDQPAIREAIRTIPIKIGQPLNNARYEDAKEKIFSTAEHLGYLKAHFEKAEILIDKQQYTTNIHLLFDTGPQYYFGQMRFDPTYLSPTLLLRYVPFKYGQPYSTEQVLALNTSLSNSGYFKAVNVKPSITDERYVPIDVNLQSANRVNYSLGIGYGTDTGPRGRAGLSIAPVNRVGDKFNIVAQGSFTENALQAQYLIPGHNPITDKYSINGGISNLNYSSGYSNAMLLSLAQQHAVSHYQRILSINGLHERYHYWGQHNNEESLLYPKAIFSWNNTTDQLFSPSGYNVTLTGFAATKALLSDINVMQASIDAKAAIMFEPIRTRLYLHGIQGATSIGNIDQLPLSLAQLLGGAENLKGYGYKSIGPGKILSYGGVELQKETIKRWYLVGFFDSGDVYSPSSRAFKHDLGAGLMWVSPIGPIKVGLAQAVDSHLGRLPGHPLKLVVNMGPDL